MANLKLPDMSYSNLLKIAGGDFYEKIAYQTFAKRQGDLVSVKHFDSDIAIMAPGQILINNHGYFSNTTTNRLHHILWANVNGRLGKQKGELIFKLDGEKYPIPNGKFTVDIATREVVVL